MRRFILLGLLLGLSACTGVGLHRSGAVGASPVGSYMGLSDRAPWAPSFECAAFAPDVQWGPLALAAGTSWRGGADAWDAAILPWTTGVGAAHGLDASRWLIQAGEVTSLARVRCSSRRGTVWFDDVVQLAVNARNPVIGDLDAEIIPNIVVVWDGEGFATVETCAYPWPKLQHAPVCVYTSDAGAQIPVRRELEVPTHQPWSGRPGWHETHVPIDLGGRLAVATSRVDQPLLVTFDGSVSRPRLQLLPKDPFLPADRTPSDPVCSVRPLQELGTSVGGFWFFRQCGHGTEASAAIGRADLKADGTIRSVRTWWSGDPVADLASVLFDTKALDFSRVFVEHGKIWLISVAFSGPVPVLAHNPVRTNLVVTCFARNGDWASSRTSEYRLPILLYNLRGTLTMQTSLGVTAPQCVPLTSESRILQTEPTSP